MRWRKRSSNFFKGKETLPPVATPHHPPPHSFHGDPVIMIHAPVHILAHFVLHTILCMSTIGVCSGPTYVTHPRSNITVDTITPPPVRGILTEGRLIRSTPPNKQTSPTKFLVYFFARYTYLLLRKILIKISHKIHRDNIRFLVYSILWSSGCHLIQLLSIHPVLIFFNNNDFIPTKALD
jgi:hypothetical protein